MVYFGLINILEFIKNNEVNIALSVILVMLIAIVSYKLNIRKLDKKIDKLRRERKKAIDESNQKTEFLTNISHEFRTPLNAIIGFTDVIKSETYGPLKNQKYKEYLDDIKNSGTHLLSIVNDILDFSKVSADKLYVDLVNTDIRKVLISSSKIMLPRAKEMGISLVYDAPKDKVISKIDAKRLKQSLLNLISNAIKFTPEGGEVKVSVQKTEEGKKHYCEISIVDNGIGIEKNNISVAMSVFGQVDSKLNRKYEGTGIGLPFTKKLVELMNGEFKIKSTLGYGTEVSIKFKCK